MYYVDCVLLIFSLCIQHATKLNRTRRAATKKAFANNPVTEKSLLDDLKEYGNSEVTSGLDTVKAQLAGV